MVLHHGHQFDVVFGIADHHATEEVLPVESEEVLLVDLLERVLVCQSFDGRRRRSFRQVFDAVIPLCALLRVFLGSMSFRRKLSGAVPVGEEIAKAGNLDAKEFELGT